MRLEQAAEEHEQLKAEMDALQEKHLEVLTALRETEDELRSYRQKPIIIVPRRLMFPFSTDYFTTKLNL